MVCKSEWFVNGKFIEKQIPLRTSSKVTARERIAEVEKVEEILNKGWSFPFLGYLIQQRPK